MCGDIKTGQLKKKHTVTGYESSLGTIAKAQKDGCMETL
jgi:hypothetical protein